MKEKEKSESLTKLKIKVPLASQSCCCRQKENISLVVQLKIESLNWRIYFCSLISLSVNSNISSQDIKQCRRPQMPYMYSISRNGWPSYNRIAQNIHWKIYQHYGASHSKNWYEHHSEAVIEAENFIILLDYRVQTGTKIKINKSGITNKNKNKTCKLIVLSDQKPLSNRVVKAIKYKYLEIEVEKLWNVEL